MFIHNGKDISYSIDSCTDLFTYSSGSRNRIDIALDIRSVLIKLSETEFLELMGNNKIKYYLQFSIKNEVSTGFTALSRGGITFSDKQIVVFDIIYDTKYDVIGFFLKVESNVLKYIDEGRMRLNF